MSKIMFYDLPNVVTQQSNDLYVLSANGTGSYNETRGQFQSWMQSSLSGIPQYIWVNENNGDDTTGNGSQNNPYASYSMALSVANSLSPSSTNQFLIKIIGDQSITGDVEFSPFIHVDSEDTGTLNCTGNFVLSSDWGGGSNPFCIVKNISLNPGTQVDFIFPIDNQPLFQFINVNFDSTVTLMGLDVSQMPNVAFDSCNIDTIDAGGITSTLCNVNITTGGNFNNNIFTNSSTTNSCVFSASCAAFNTITVNCTDGGNIGISLFGVQYTPNNFTINGNNFSLEQDASSYNSIPVLNGGASISNVQADSITDGLTLSSYTPTNFTPVGSSNYRSDSLTAVIAGIDSAMPSSAIVFASYLSADMSGVTGDGTNYVLPCDMQLGPSCPYYDNAGTFTAPQSGFYTFSGAVHFNGVTANNTTGYLILLTNSANYVLGANDPFVIDPPAASGSYNACQIVYLNSGDTASIVLQIDGEGSKNINISGGNPPSGYIWTVFSGASV